MIHYSCDMCGKEIPGGDNGRYVVRIEVYAAHDPATLTDDDLDADAVESLSQMLANAAPDADLAAQLPPARSELRYDLCPKCHQRYLRNPLAQKAALQFSEN